MLSLNAIRRTTAHLPRIGGGGRELEDWSASLDASKVRLPFMAGSGPCGACLSRSPAIASIPSAFVFNSFVEGAATGWNCALMSRSGFASLRMSIMAGIEARRPERIGS